MKFSDIPQFTRSGSYEGNFTMPTLVRRIKEWEKEEFLEMNPDFQRGNVWTEEQKIAYIEFLIKGGKTGLTFYFNNKHWTNCKEPQKGIFVCVDGLQRITAITDFVENRIKAFGYYFNEYEDKEIFSRRYMELKVNINDLQTREEVLQLYLDFNTGGTVHSDEEIIRVRELLEKERNK